MIKETAVLTFRTSEEGKRVVRIPDPTAIITQSVEDLAVDGIMSANPFDETLGSLEELISSERLVVDTTPLITPTAA